MAWNCHATAKTADKAEYCVTYSPTFQRHLVVAKQPQNYLTNNAAAVVASYAFLDEAQAAHPNAQCVGLYEPIKNHKNPEASRHEVVAGGGTAEQTAYLLESSSSSSTIIINKTEEEEEPWDETQALRTLATLAVGNANQTSSIDSMAKFLADRVAPHRLVSPARLNQNVQSFQSLLQKHYFSMDVTTTVLQSILANFPLVVLYEPRFVRERLQFFCQPLVPQHSEDDDDDNIDWPRWHSLGFGAGWTLTQLEQALVRVPHVVLALRHEDAALLQPTLLYCYQVLQVPYRLCDEARLALEDYLTGATASDVCTFALLRSLGLSWRQLRCVLQAFPMLAVCETEPSWEMLDQKGIVRSILKRKELHYLRMRLQIGPGEVQAMIKTHSRLSTYSLEGKLRPTLNALQSKLGLTSRELQRVVLRMPSVLGISIEPSSPTGLLQRIHFFQKEVGMTPSDLRKAVVRQPSLLHYSVHRSLGPKLTFLREELKVPPAAIRKVVATYPAVMGLSLEDNLRPSMNAIMEYCSLTPEEMGDIVARAPNLLMLSWKRNLEPTLKYLTDRLGLSKSQIKSMVLTTPRILYESTQKSLQPKLDMLESALVMEGSERQAISNVVMGNPALLVGANSQLQKRLDRPLNDLNVSLTESLRFQSWTANKRPRRRRIVQELDLASGELVTEYPSARAAAAELGTSLPNFYSIVNTGRIWKGHKYIYGEARKPKEVAVTNDEQHATADVLTNSEEEGEMVAPRRPPTTAVGSKTENLVFRSLKGALRSVPYPSILSEQSDAAIHILVYVSGRAYPPDGQTLVRGMRRAGGSALYFPQVDQYRSRGPELALKLRQAAGKAFTQIMPNGTCYEEGIILAGFPYLRPSRNRCDLYACHNALKLLLQLLKHNPFPEEHIHMDVCTDSDYAWKLLKNSTRLHRWGSHQKLMDFVFDGEGPVSRANPDLLHPLCRTYYRLVEQRDIRESPTETESSFIKLARKLSVSFHHAATVRMYAGGLEDLQLLHRNAKKAAEWQYQRARTAHW